MHLHILKTNSFLCMNEQKQLIITMETVQETVLQRRMHSHLHQRVTVRPVAGYCRQVTVFIDMDLQYRPYCGYVRRETRV